MTHTYENVDGATASSEGAAGGSRVGIIGGGAAGLALARRLGAPYRVTLVDPKDGVFFHNGFPKALVDPPFLRRTYTPYAQVLPHVTHVTGRADRVEGTRVLLADGTRLEFDHVAIASGVGYGFPAGSDDDYEVTDLRLRALLARIDDARVVVVAGGGPVGCELASRIRARRPAARTVLVTRSSRLVDTGWVGEDLSRRTHERLLREGVEIVLGAAVGGGEHPVPGRPDIRPDVVVDATGGTQRAPFHLGRRGPAGLVAVNAFLQTDDPRFFALGDVADSGEKKLGIAASRMAATVAANIEASRTGAPLTAYRAMASSPMIVALARGAVGANRMSDVLGAVVKHPLVQVLLYRAVTRGRPS